MQDSSGSKAALSLRSRIAESSSRVELFRWCRELVRLHPKELRLVYEDQNFHLERRIKLCVGEIWIRELSSE